MWDPTGSRFLVRTTIRIPGRWNVYELDGTRVSTSEYDISDSLLPAYLPFWDQYARSQTQRTPGSASGRGRTDPAGAPCFGRRASATRCGCAPA